MASSLPSAHGFKPSAHEAGNFSDFQRKFQKCEKSPALFVQGKCTDILHRQLLCIGSKTNIAFSTTKGIQCQSVFLEDGNFIQQKNRDVSLEAADEEKLFNRLWRIGNVWPANTTKLQLQYFEGKSGTWRGILATETVPVGGVLLAVPSSHVLHVVLETAGDGDSRAAVCKLARNLLTAIRDPAAIWYQYASLLPKIVESPAFWSAEERAELQSVEAERHCVAHREWLERAAKAVDDDLEAAIWALQMVLSRAFTCKREGSTMQMLVPFADMLNHSHRPPKFQHSKTSDLSLWRFTKTSYAEEMFEVRSPLHLETGQEATIDYGPHTSTEFLITFGYVPSVNPFNKVQLYASLQELIDDVEERISMMRFKEEILQSFCSIDQPLWVYSGGIATETQLFSMLLHAKEREEISLIQRSLEGQGGMEAGVSVATKKLAARQIRQRCLSLLDSYSSTYDDDVGLLEGLSSQQQERTESQTNQLSESQTAESQCSHSQSHNEQRLRLALDHRMAEKLVLKACLSTCMNIETHGDS